MIADTKRILLVEDNPGDVRLLVELLREYGKAQFFLDHVNRIDKALEQLEKQNYDLLMLDLTLPDGSGLATVLRITDATVNMPIIVLTGLDDDTLAIEAVQAGAQDYLVKGQLMGPLLIRTMNHAIERKRMEERIYFLAHHDSLTNLPNRALFQDRLVESINRSKRNRRETSKKWDIAIMMIDLDHFKGVNDTLGHPHGDFLLQAVAVRLQETIRQTDTVARMGGDEFMVIFENVNDQDDAEILGRKILDLFSRPFAINGRELQVTASIGIGLYPADGEDLQSLMFAADAAMYRAKHERNCFCLYRTSNED